MKILVPSVEENWINDRIVSEYRRHTRHEIVELGQKFDIAWINTPSLVNFYGPGLYVLTIAHIVPEKFNNLNELYNFESCKQFDQSVSLYTSYSDHTISFINRNSITKKQIIKIPYWINTELFFEIPDLLDERLFTIGSFQRDTEGSDLESPKLEKGPDIFIKVLKEIKKHKTNLRVLLSGLRRQYVIKQLEELDIEYEYYEMCDFKKMNELYNMCDYYLVTSRYEGGPQAILEASQTKCKILSTNVGVSKDILHQDCVCKDESDMVWKILTGVDKTEYNYLNVQNYEMKKVISQYDEFFESLVES